MRLGHRPFFLASRRLTHGGDRARIADIAHWDRQKERFWVAIVVLNKLQRRLYRRYWHHVLTPIKEIVLVLSHVLD